MYDELITSMGRVVGMVLPNTPAALKSSLNACIKLREPLLKARVEAQTTLASKREQARYPKDKEFTDFDRTIMLEAAVSEYSARYETLRGLENLLTERVDILRLLIAS